MTRTEAGRKLLSPDKIFKLFKVVRAMAVKQQKKSRKQYPLFIPSARWQRRIVHARYPRRNSRSAYE